MRFESYKNNRLPAPISFKNIKGKSKFLDEVKRVLESKLPTSTSITREIIRVMHDNSSSAMNVAEVIEHDPAMTANVLKIANSAYYGSSTNITSIKFAVTILGHNALMELISTICVVRCFIDCEKNGKNDLKDIWYHSIGTAKACQFISVRMSIEQPEIAYLVGLLHDVGKILIILYFPDNYREVVQLAAEKKTRFLLAERKILKTDHTIIGNFLCELWALPKDLNMAITYHHCPMGSQGYSQKLARIVELGDYMCRTAQIGFSGYERIEQPSPATMALLGIKPETVKNNFEAILEKLEVSKSEIDNFFQQLEQ